MHGVAPTQKGGGFPPFFVWLTQDSSRLAWAFVLSLFAHGLLLLTPLAIEGGRFDEARHRPPAFDVRLRGETPPQVADASPPPSSPDTLAPPPQPGVPLPARYFESSEVDVRAQPIQMEPLIYPENAYLRRIPGEVKFRVFINESGIIDTADILAADPPDIFERAALDALLKTRFKPAEILGRPVKSVKTVVVRFDPFVDRP